MATSRRRRWFTTRVARVRLKVGKAEVSLIDADDGVVRHEKKGGFELRTREIWSRLCGADKTVLDIGAYTGLYAIAASLLGAKARAFEPNPANIERLRENIKANDAWVAVHEIAASDEDGVALMWINPKVRLTSGGSIVRHKQFEGAVKVDTTRIDALRFPWVHVMKIDVERAETKVIAGAIETIRRCRPTIIAECLEPHLGETIRAMLPQYIVKEVMDDTNWLFVPR